MTLAKAGWIEPESGDLRKWRLAMKPILRFQVAANDRGNLRARAIFEMEKLRDLTNETVHLSLREGNEIITLEEVASTHTMRIVVPLGSHNLLHRACSGIAVMSCWSPADVDAYIKKFCASETTGECIQLREQIEQGRREGFVIHDYASMDGRIVVSAPIKDNSNNAVAALSVSAPAPRVSKKKLRSIGKELVEAAIRISGSQIT